MNKRYFLIALLSAAAGVIALQSTTGRVIAPLQSAMQEHERLRIHNTFKAPEDVVRYYVNRDASGFVWSGLLDAERAAFTTWKDAPQHDSFFIATRYEIIPVRANKSDEAQVEVRYVLKGVGDAHGTLVPAQDPHHRVLFNLKKVNGLWKIASPEPPSVSPVVLESNFPTVTAQN